MTVSELIGILAEHSQEDEVKFAADDGERPVDVVSSEGYAVVLFDRITWESRWHKR